MNNKLKIFLLLGAACIISSFCINNVFLAKSPRINSFFAKNLIAKASSLLSKTKEFIASNNPFTSVTTKNLSQEVQNNINNIPLTKVSMGVYAGEKNNTIVYKIITGEIEYLEYTFNVNSKEIKIKVPKDQQPPSQEIVNALYK